MQLNPLSIGPVTLDLPVMLAPMAGYTNYPFRLLCRQHHCALTFTEMVVSEGIVRRSPRTMHYLESFEDERPVGAHIYGHDPDSLVEAAEVVESLGRFDLIDLNGGCPVPKIRRRGAGVGLMKDPAQLFHIVSRMAAAVSLPITVKTRTGLSTKAANLSEVAAACEEGGAKALFVHARLASNVHRGPPDLETLARVKEELSIPVIGNGGITEPEHALDMIRKTGVDGVMIGRASIGNPWFFDRMHCALTGEAFVPPTRQERRDTMAEHLQGLHESILREEKTRRRRRRTAEQVACQRFRSHMVKYLGGLRNIGEMRRRLSSLDTIEQVLEIVDAVLDASND